MKEKNEKDEDGDYGQEYDDDGGCDGRMAEGIPEPIKDGYESGRTDGRTAVQKLSHEQYTYKVKLNHYNQMFQVSLSLLVYHFHHSE